MRYRKCRQCSEKFPVTKHWRVFCSDKCKVRWNRDHHDHCFFCGTHTPSGQRHHIEPCAWRGERRFANQEYVLTCNSCNLLIGSKRFDSALDTVDFLLSKYKPKLKPKPEWSDEELAELGRGLRQRIKKILAKENVLRSRVLYLEALQIHMAADQHG